MTRLQDFLNSPIKNVTPMAGRARAGDLFGIEVECEGVRVAFDGEDRKLLEDWQPHNDGSLRPYKNNPPMEWVFNGPVKYKKAIERVEQLFEYFKKRKTQLVPSNRTSIHVHFNMGDKTVYQLVNLYILFTIIEDIMDSYCGEDRNGNLFCLSSRHAEEQLRWISDACFNHFQIQYREQNRYCSLNLASMCKFGTVEFRGMRGLDNGDDIIRWLDILKEFCEYACYKMNNPVNLIEEISQKTPIGFLKEIFSEHNYNSLTNNLNEDDINRSIYDGLRLVQMLCYKIGTEFDQVRLRGRDFWASFKEDGPEIPDVDPQVFVFNEGLERPANAPRQLAGRARAGLRIQNPGRNAFIELAARDREVWDGLRQAPNFQVNPGVNLEDIRIIDEGEDRDF